MEEIFRYAMENNKSQEASLYSQDGYLKLKPKLQQLADKYGVHFIDIKEE